MNHTGPNPLMDFYHAMLERFGHQQWWPGETPFEVMVGAVLTQNTNWANVQKAIHQLKTAQKLDPQTINALSHDQLAQLIRPAGYFNIKAKRLKNLVKWLCENSQGEVLPLKAWPIDRLREELLAINGIGKETADSIILYALEKTTFVVDTYTYRILVRHGCIYPEADYEELKSYCESQLPTETQLFNEVHALIVRVGKEFCKPKPKCQGCPLQCFEHRIEEFD